MGLWDRRRISLEASKDDAETTLTKALTWAALESAMMMVKRVGSQTVARDAYACRIALAPAEGIRLHTDLDSLSSWEMTTLTKTASNEPQHDRQSGLPRGS